jgi:molybdate transport system ATP-binding protein
MIEIALRKALLGSGGAMELAVELRIESGSFVAIAGESGSGKTTLLRILAGLERSEGRIAVDGELWMEGRRSLPPRKRRIGFVFQDYALFENMTVRENLLFVRPDRALAERLMTLCSLEALAERYPATLSGGQQQRVALCRALMGEPKLLLMDEPLSALDPAMRRRLQEDIARLHREFGTTTLMVSHDPAEIYRLGDRGLSLEQGRIVGDAAPLESLLETAGSQKFSFRGELLEIVRRDVLHVAVVAIGQQIVEVVLSEAEAGRLEPGRRVIVSAKAFAPMILPEGGEESL